MSLGSCATLPGSLHEPTNYGTPFSQRISGIGAGARARRLLHEALPAIDVKWVAQVWVRHGEDLYQAFMNTPESR